MPVEALANEFLRACNVLVGAQGLGPAGFESRTSWQGRTHGNRAAEPRTERFPWAPRSSRSRHELLDGALEIDFQVVEPRLLGALMLLLDHSFLV